MAGTDFIFNIAKGRIAHYASLPATNDALVLVLFKAAGLATDAALKDLDTLSAIKAVATEADFTNYARKTLASVTVAVDDTNDRVNIDCADVVYTNAGGTTNNQMGKAIICYDPDTTTGTDADLIPLGAYSYDGTTDGSTITLTMPTDGPLYAQ
jgi:hypothetical protein